MFGASGDGVNWERVADEVAMGRRVGGDIFVRGDRLYFYGGIRSGGYPRRIMWFGRREMGCVGRRRPGILSVGIRGVMWNWRFMVVRCG